MIGRRLDAGTCWTYVYVDVPIIMRDLIRVAAMTTQFAQIFQPPSVRSVNPLINNSDAYINLYPEENMK